MLLVNNAIRSDSFTLLLLFQMDPTARERARLLQEKSQELLERSQNLSISKALRWRFSLAHIGRSSSETAVVDVDVGIGSVVVGGRVDDDRSMVALVDR